MSKKEIIFDTDLGSDCDDVMALTYLMYAEDYLNVEIKAITHSLKTKYGVPAIRSMFKYFGRKCPSVGAMQGGADLVDIYAEKLAKTFASDEDYNEPEAAVKVLRKALVESENKCVICGVGQFTNLGALFLSGADEISNLNGIELLKEKCEKIVLMAGKFVDELNGLRETEWNVKWDVSAAETVLKLSPVPIVMLPFETGVDVITGKNFEEKYGTGNPLTLSFNLHPGAVNGRSSWDPITVLYAVEGAKNFLIETVGDVTLSESGQTYFAENSQGKVTVLTLNYNGFSNIEECYGAISNYIDACAEKVLKRL